MSVDWSNLLRSFRRISPAAIIAIAALASTLLYLPRDQAVLLGVEQLRDQYRPWIGLSLLSSIAVLLGLFLQLAQRGVELDEEGLPALAKAQAVSLRV